MINNNICPVKLEYFAHNTNKIERIIILTSNFHINLLKQINILYIDGTFNTYPCSFYQKFNILGYIQNKNISFSIIACLLTSKNEKIYNYAFI